MPGFDRDELFRLADAAVEGRLTPADAAALERLALGDAAALKLYVEYVHQHGALAFTAGDVGPLPPARPRRRRWVAALAGLAAALLVGIGTWAATRPAGVATLVAARACKWDGGSLPTEPGARLTTGRLRLSEGLARLRFDCGAELALEGPADLEIAGPMRCVLHAGRLVAKVSPKASGFLVDTPNAVLKDLGTEFGVNVHEGRAAEVQVFNGRVDVTHRGSGQTAPVLTGKSLRVTPDGMKAYTPMAEGERPATEIRSDVLAISTAFGRGKDGYATPMPFHEHRSDVLLLVKNSLPKQSGFFRKAFMGFDLAPLAGRKLADAQLTLTLAPTGMGFASEVPDATFVLYGLTDPALEDWNPVLDWKTAPANRDGGDELDKTKVVRLGSFVVPQGVQSGPCAVAGPDLARFLGGRAGAVATLILVRETRGSGRMDLVHGFASRRHPTLPPPTLKVTVEGK